LSCECSDDTFIGLPCGHQLAIFLKSKISDSLLSFKSRWRQDYYQEKEDLLEPEEITLDQNDPISEEANF